LCVPSAPEWSNRSLALLLRTVAADAPSMARLRLAGTSLCQHRFSATQSGTRRALWSLPGTNKLRLLEFTQSNNISRNDALDFPGYSCFFPTLFHAFSVFSCYEKPFETALMLIVMLLLGGTISLLQITHPTARREELPDLAIPSGEPPPPPPKRGEPEKTFLRWPRTPVPAAVPAPEDP